MSDRTERSAARRRAPSTSARKGPRRSGLAHWEGVVRSGTYQIVATAWFVLITTFGIWMLLLPPEVMRGAFNAWARSDMWLLKVIAGQRTVILGRQNVPDGPALIASKHQSAWETLALLPILPSGSIVMKKELMRIPLFGWYARHFGMIPVDRAAGASALKRLAADAGEALAAGRQIVVFPEGTRRLVGAPPDYKPGAIFLYEKLGVPMVPVALNSGLLWPRGRWVRYPGTITVSFLPPIPPGLDRRTARSRLIEAIETESDRLARL